MYGLVGEKSVQICVKSVSFGHRIYTLWVQGQAEIREVLKILFFVQHPMKLS